MANKTIKGSLIHRHDTAINWYTIAHNYVPAKGEMIVFDADEPTADYGENTEVLPSTQVRFKIGDGVKNVIELPFMKSDTQNKILDYITYKIVTTGSHPYVSITDCDTSISDSHTLPELIEGYPVERIDANAFKDCVNLKWLILPDTLQYINSNAFENSGLISLELPYNCWTVGAGIFTNCKNLQIVKLPETMALMPADMFTGCKNLASIELPKMLGPISNAFQGCTRLSEISIPLSVSSITAEAFEGCTQLKDIYYEGTQEQWEKFNVSGNLPEGVTVHYNQELATKEYVQDTLNDYYTKTEVNNLACVKNTYEDTDVGCFSINSPDREQYIDLYNDDNIDIYAGGHNIDINGAKIIDVGTPEEDTDVANKQYVDKEKNKILNHIAYEIENNVVSIVACDEAITGQHIIPDTIEGYPVKTIDTEAFYNCVDLTSLVIPDTVTQIVGNAFAAEDDAEPMQLREIKLSNSLTYINGNTFSGLEQLHKIHIPRSVEGIGHNAFAYCDNLQSVYIEDGITTLEDSVFFECASLNRINLPNTITSIGESVFAGCRSLNEIVLPNRLTQIYAETFAECSQLQKVHIPSTVTTIGADAFYNCDALTDIYYEGTREQWENIDVGNLNEHYDSITIHYNQNLVTTEYLTQHYFTDIEVEDLLEDKEKRNYLKDYLTCSVDASSQATVTGYSGLRQIVVIPDYWNGCPVRKIGEAAFVERQIADVILPSCLTSIGNYAFSRCDLYTIMIHNGVETIGDDAFEGCQSLTSITIPDSVTHIGQGAFYGCSSLTSLTIGKGVQNIGHSLCFGCSALKSLTIPHGVTNIDSYAFKNCTSLTSITIPDSVTSIFNGAFDGCTKLTDIYYEGTQEQWDAITKKTGNDVLSTAIIHYNQKFLIADGITTEDSTINITKPLHLETYDFEFNVNGYTIYWANGAHEFSMRDGGDGQDPGTYISAPGPVDIDSSRLINVDDPVDDADATNKKYVDDCTLHTFARKTVSDRLIELNDISSARGMEIKTVSHNTPDMMIAGDTGAFAYQKIVKIDVGNSIAPVVITYADGTEETLVESVGDAPQYNVWRINKPISKFIDEDVTITSSDLCVVLLRRGSIDNYTNEQFDWYIVPVNDDLTFYSADSEDGCTYTVQPHQMPLSNPILFNLDDDADILVKYIPTTHISDSEKAFEIGENVSGQKYIKVGNTELTEEKLNALLALLS